MQPKSFLFLALLGMAVLLSEGVSYAQEAPAQQPAAEEKKDDKLPTGVIASFGRHAHRASVDAAATPTAGDEQTAIGGSISRNGNRCIARLVNSSKDRYSVGFAVIGTSPTGSQSFRRTYSSTIGPEETISRELSCGEDDNVRIEITSGRRLSK